MIDKYFQIAASLFVHNTVLDIRIGGGVGWGDEKLKTLHIVSVMN